MGLKEAIQNIWGSDYTQKNPNKAYKTSYAAEYAAVAAYLNGGAEPVWQNFSKLGKGLCEAEKHRRAEVPVPPVEPPPVEPPAGSKPLTNSITSGGVYSGTVTGTVSINTTQPVTITAATITNTSGGTLVNCSGAVDVTLDHVKAFGGTGRFFEAENYKSVIVRNCTIEKTSGIVLLYGQAGGSVLITRNRHHNIQRVPGSVGNFVQFRVVQNPTIDVSWNEIVNEYDASDPEDIVSIYYTAHTRIHDNYLQHQSKPGNAYNTSSQNSITLEGDARLNDNIIESNQVVDAFGVSIFNGSNPTGSGHDNSLLNNRVIADGLLPNGQKKGNGAGASMYIASGGQNNHAHGNVVGAIGRDGGQLHYDLAGAAEGHAAEVAKNTELPVSQINAAAEQAEWTRWQEKVTAAGLKIGA